MKKKALLGVLSLMSAFALASCGESETPTTPDQSQKDDDKGGTDKVVTKHTVTVNTSDASAGSVTGAGSYDAGTTVTVTATTNEGYVFLGFYKGENKVSENKTYSFKLDADVTLTAKYRALADYTVTVNVNEAAAGSVTGAGTVKEGSSVTLTATTNTGYLFLGFYDSADNALTTEPTYTINNVTKNETINAKYRAKDQYAVIVANTNEDAGSITGSGNVSEGDTVTLTATVNAGYTFLGFYDGETRVSDANATTYTFKPTADTNLTAKWLVQEFDFDVEIVEAGDGSVETGEVSYTDDNDNNGKYKTNEVIKLTATPKTGYQFKGWYVGDTFLSDQDEDYEFVMLPQNTTVKAVFEDKQCSISIYSDFDAPAEYKITVEGDNGIYGCGDTFLYGSEITITVNPEAGLTFKRFYTLDENDNKITFDATDFVITDDIDLYAEFEAEKKVVTTDLDINSNKINPTDPIATITVVDGDGISDVDDEYYYKSKIVVKLEDLDDGFVFDGWYKYDSVEDDYVLISEYEEFEYYIKATDNDFVAKVTPKKVSVTVVNDTSDLGSINYETDEFEYLEVLDLEAVAESGYRLKAITIDGVTYTDTEVEYQITSLEDITITVEFEKDVFDVNTYINVSSSLDDVYVNQFYAANDSLTSNGAGVEYQGTHKVTAEDIDGYTFVGWYAGKFNGDTEEGYKTLDALVTDLEYEFTMGAANVELTACYERNKYKIELNTSYEGVTKDRFSVEFGKKIQLEVPTQTGKAFQYWYYIDDNDNNVALTDANGMMLKPYSLTENITIRAKFLDGKVIATFDTQGGSPIDPAEVTYNDVITKPADPKREGYTFLGWFDSEGTTWNWHTAIVKNTTLYAHWSINQYELTITSQDSSIVVVNSEANASYDYGTKVTLTATLPDKGYSFAGWEIDGNIVSTSPSYEYTIPAKDVTVKATYAVNQFNLNVSLYNWTRNTATIVSGPGKHDYKSQVTIEVKPNDGFHVYMYSVNGGSWVGLSENTLTIEMPNVNTNILIGIDCYRYKFTVSKNITDGEDVYFLDSTGTTKYTSTTTYWAWKKTLVAQEIEGYEFKGWYFKGTDDLIKEDATTLTYVIPGIPDHGKVIGPEDNEIEARYEPITYNMDIIKNVNGETTNLVEDEKIDYKETYQLGTENITGYTFKGWFVNGSDTPISTDLDYEYTMPASDVTIVAKYDINKYLVEVDYNSGNTTNTIIPGAINLLHGYSGNYDYNSTIDLTVNSTTDGYDWVGWFVNGANVSVETTYKLTVGAMDYDIVPTWKPKQVTLVYSLGTATIPSGAAGKKVTMGEQFTLEVPQATGQTFGGWYYVDDDLNKVYITDDEGNSTSYYEYYSSSNVMIQAAWGVTMQTVTFNTDGGSTVNSAKVEYNNKVSQPADPTKKGHTFLGWYVGESKWDFATNVVTEDITLTAKWQVNKYSINIYLIDDGDWGTVSFEINGVTTTLDKTTTNIELELDYGTPIKFKAHAFKGRVFDYWYYADEDCDVYDDIYDDASYVEYTDNFEYAANMNIGCSFRANDDMKYFTFTSDDTNVEITGSNSSYHTITSLVVPNYVTSIKDGALSNFVKLTTISLPFTGISRDATGIDKLYTTVFSKTSLSGTTSRYQSYLNGSTLTSAPVRYVPTSLYNIRITDETKIAPCAFYNLQARCSSIVLPNNLEEIGDYAFYLCYITNVNLPTSLKKISNYAFMNTNLASINIPNNNMTYIGTGAFMNCSKISSMTLPFIGKTQNATGIEGAIGWIFGTTAFNGGYAAEMINGTKRYIPSTLTTITINPNTSWDYTISAGAFMNLTNVTTINSPADECDSVIPAKAFYGCTSLTTIGGTILEDTYDAICELAFANCTSLTEIAITGEKSSNFYIGDEAFESCTALEKFTCEYPIKQLGMFAFAECSALGEFSVTAAAGVGVGTIYDAAFSNCTSLTKFLISSGRVSYIEESAFSGCTALKEFKLTYVHNYINSYAFENCTSLTTFDVTYLGSSANSGTNAIGSFAFLNCTSLKEITISKSVKQIGQNIFLGCKSLEKITAPFIGKDRNGSLTTGNTDYNVGYWFGNDTKTGTKTTPFVTSLSTKVNYILPDTNLEIHLTDVIVVPAFALATTTLNFTTTISIDGYYTGGTQYSIGDYAFAAFDGSNLSSYTMTSNLFRLQNLCDGLVSIGVHAFRGRRNVFVGINGQLPTTLTTIKEFAFYNVNTAVEEVVVPDSVTVIGDNAFRGTNAGKYTIGKYAVLGSGVFGKLASAATALYFNGTVAELANIRTKWNSNWNSDSKFTSIICTDNTYVI